MSLYSKESAETKRKILVAAKKEFAAKGFSGARMSSIAATAGVNQALIHYYFSNKENLYRELFQVIIGGIFEKYSDIFRAEMDSWDVDPDLELCASIFILINAELYVHDDELYRIIVHEVAEGRGVLHEFVKEYIMPQMSLFNDIIDEGVESGIFEISDTFLFAMNIINFIQNMAHSREFLHDTGLFNDFQNNICEVLYNFMTEFSFKALKPGDKDIIIPALDEDRKTNLNAILKQMSFDVKNIME